MSVSWDEVRKLAADFQRTQLTEASQRLTERNCVEIVRKIIQLKLVDVLFTTDGKEYITPSHLLTEIENELFANNGRVYLTDLVTTLQMDPNIIEQKANELAKQSGGRINLVLGQLISIEFKDQVANELNERLQAKGTMTLSEMVKLFDFPPDFLQSLLNARIGTLVQAVQDPNDSQIYFTEAFLNQYKARIMGVFNGITKPTALSHLIASYKFPAKIFNTVICELMKETRVRGTLTTGQNGIFTPEIYLRAQQQWLDSFLAQNSYVEFDALQRIGVSDPRAYCKKREETLLMLSSCAVTKLIYDQVESAIEETLREQNWFDLLTLTSSVLDSSDLKCLFNIYVENHRQSADQLLLIDSIVVCKRFIENLLPTFENEIKKNVSVDLENGNYATYVVEKQGNRNSGGMSAKAQNASRKEERKRQSVGKQKSGGGQQGREVKIKAVKKKYNKKDDCPGSDDEQTSFFNISTAGDTSVKLSFIDEEKVVSLLPQKRPSLEYAPQQLLNQLARYLSDPLRERFLESAQKAFEDQQSSSSSESKKTHFDLQQTVNHLYSNIVLFEKGCKCCSADLKTQLEKHLLKTACVELLNALLNWASAEDAPPLNTIESRLKCIKKLPNEFVEPFTRLNAAVNGNSLEEFYFAADQAAEKVDILLRRVDKRKEKQLLLECHTSLHEQLRLVSNDDAAMILHLSILLLFNSINGQTIHASGKFVPQLLSELRPKLKDDVYSLLSKCEQLVVRKFKKDSDDAERHEINSELEEIVPKIKNLVQKTEEVSK